MRESIKPNQNLPETKKIQVTHMFNGISKRYDILNRIITFGIDVLWRKKVVKRLRKEKHNSLLDLATGTGDQIIELAKLDADKIIDKMMSSWRWEQNKYYGKTKEQIQADWDKNRDEAASAGTKMHYDIECYYNECPNENNSVEYGYFKKFLTDFPQLNSRPYRTEWMVYHEELKLVGSIDMIYEDKDGKLYIYDWKRSKEIKKTNPDLADEIKYMSVKEFKALMEVFNVWCRL